MHSPLLFLMLHTHTQMLALHKAFCNSINHYLTRIIFSYASFLNVLHMFLSTVWTVHSNLGCQCSYSQQNQLQEICVHFYAIDSRNLNQFTQLCKNLRRENSFCTPAYHITIHSDIQVFASCNPIYQIAIKVQDLAFLNKG